MKRRIKSLVLWLLGMAVRDRHAKVIYYHDVGTKYTKMGTVSDLFWAHVAVAGKAGWRIVPRSDFQDPSLKSGADGRKLLLCFDDGFRGIWDERERFRAEGLCPTVFIPVSLVGTPGHLTWDEIRILQDGYGFDFQSHTWSHQTLAGLGIEKMRGQEIVRDDAWFEHELVECRREIGKRLDKEVDALCFPAGMFSEDVLVRCASAGYRFLFTSYPGVFNIHPPACFVHLQAAIVPRNLCQFATVDEFKSILRGALLPLSKRYRGMHFVG